MAHTAEHVQRWRDNHHRALEALATNGKSGKQLWQALNRLEHTAHKRAEDYCNGTVTVEQWEAFAEKAERAVGVIFGKVPAGFHLNGDPRGYALKLDPDHGATIPEGMHKDWGGYGILAAVIE
jgi:hypothetical protein